jgi:hypothetical protein
MNRDREIIEQTSVKEAPQEPDKKNRQNCWDFKKCGREPGGDKAGELGICPAAEDSSSDGINGGTNGGRICWTVAGTFCGGKVQGSFAQKRMSCLNCDLFKKVMEEEGIEKFLLTKPGEVLK